MDEDLVVKIAKGDSKAFESLYYKYKNFVFGLSMKFLNDRNKAEEITQEVWLRVAKRAGQFKAESRFSTWLGSIVKNLCLDEIRKFSDKGHVELDAEIEKTISDGVSLEQIFENKESFVVLQKSIMNLPVKQRVALLLTLENEDLDQSDLAIQMGVSVGNFKVLIFRAKESLLQELKKEGL